MSGDYEDDVLSTELRAHVLLMTINRPHVRNAIDASVARGIGDTLRAAEHDREIRAVVITGAGEAAFCAGADLAALSRGEKVTPPDEPYSSWGFACLTTHPISKPIIAAVNGAALGGGFEIVLACDLVVASDRAVFGLPEVRRGVLPRGGGAFRMTRQIPVKVAMEYLLTGRDFTADVALSVGMINRVVPPDDVLPAALELAREISANAPLAVQAAKRIARGMVNGELAGEQAAWRHTDDEAAAILRSHDSQEGRLAFLERRSPKWSGE